MLTYNLIHRSDLLQQDAGTFYNHYYEDNDNLTSLFDSECWSGQLLLEEALDAAKMGYRNRIPVLHRDIFFPIEIGEQEYLKGRYYLPAYGDEDLHYGDEDLRYGTPKSGPAGAIALPPGIIDVDTCCDLPVDPSTILLKNEDFDIRNGYLVFRENLFDVLPNTGEYPNRHLILWLRSAYSDRRYVQDRLGILTKSFGESVEEYKTFCNKIMDSIVEGTNRWRLNQLICLIYDIACAEHNETVQHSGAFQGQQYIVTDKQVYWAPMSATFIYGPGDTLLPGTPLTNAITETSAKNLPENIPLFIPRRFFGSDFISGLMFPNEDVKLSLNPEIGKLTFPITGNYADILLFWKTFYEKADHSGMLYAASVGGWLNPAMLIYKTFLYPRLRFYRIDVKKIGYNKLNVVNTQVFRELLPPNILFSLQIEADVVEQNYMADLKYTILTPVIGMTPVKGDVPDLTYSVNTKFC
ncbi:hypothetical protein FACS1894214_0010 [Planctomycetales bacterium]|nr:hypothetical protein FACS1894214_0010 [Planctomycetales bacterium]